MMMMTTKMVHFIVVLLCSLLLLAWSPSGLVTAGPSSGSPFYPSRHGWRISSSPFNNNNKSPMTTSSSSSSSSSTRSLSPYLLNERQTKLLNSLQEKSSLFPDNKYNGGDAISIARGGQDAAPFVKFVGTVTQVLIACGNVVLPPVVGVISLVSDFYRALPKDAIVAQVGLVYCFAGGYYPTLFSSLSAAQQCGWNVMVEAIQDLTNEAVAVIRALEEHAVKQQASSFFGTAESRALLFRQKTGVVLATVDPMKINTAASALYTTWLGVSSVLEKEYARVITLSLTMAGYLENMAQFILAPPARMCIGEKYHQWIPVVIGWGCKAAAMNIAWRIQRLMTAATSAVTGGLLFARAIARMLNKRGIRLFGMIREDKDDTATMFDEVVGFLVAGLGFYTQFEAQWRNGFSFQVPWPVYLITWPFDWAEKWIQWQITK